MDKNLVIVTTAVRLADRNSSVTAGDLAEAVSCPLRTAQRQLQRLARLGILTREVPLRVGKKKGDWRIEYRAARLP